MVIFQSYVSNGNSSSNKLLSSINEISNVLFSTLEKHLSTLMEDPTLCVGKEHSNLLRTKLSDAVGPLTSKASSSFQEEHKKQLFCCKNKVAVKSLLKFQFLIPILLSFLLLGYIALFFTKIKFLFFLYSKNSP